MVHLNCAVCYNTVNTHNSAARPEGRGSADAYQPNYTVLYIRRLESQKTSTCTCVQRAYTEEVMSLFLPAVRMFQLDDRLPHINHSAVAFYSRDAFLKTSHQSKLVKFKTISPAGINGKKGTCVLGACKSKPL
jgi:hypothetical protein